MKEKQPPSETEQQAMLRQIRLINKLAIRLPWIVMGISLLAFVIIFLQLYFTKS